MTRECWGFEDARTGERVSVSSCYTEEQAWRQITSWRDRDIRGGRPDVHEIMPYLRPVRIW